MESGEEKEIITLLSDFEKPSMPYSSNFPVGTVKQVADYMRKDYFLSGGLKPAKWNLGDTGEFSKSGVLTYKFDSITKEAQQAFLEAFELFQPLGIRFTEAKNNVDIKITENRTSSSEIYKKVSANGIIQSVEITWNDFYYISPDLILAELSQALGLGRPGDNYTRFSNVKYGGSGTIFANDSKQISSTSRIYPRFIWNNQDKIDYPSSYAQFGENSWGDIGVNLTLMPADWQALSDMYSEYGYSPTKGFTDDTVFGTGTNITKGESKVFANLLFNLNLGNALTIIDGAGTDTINMQGVQRDQIIDLRGTSANSSDLNASTVGDNKTSFGNLLIAPGVTIENATGGSGNDRLIGNDANNVLDGGFGDDRMAGLEGNDTYIIDNNNDIVVEEVNQGTDTAKSSVTRVLSENIENLVLVGTDSINGTGNKLRNNITGNNGANILDGKSGPDILTGLAGNDTYFVDNIQDSLIEKANQGTDTVQSSVSWSLAKEFENLSLLGSKSIDATGNGNDNILIGNSGSNNIIGEGGADTLDGAGGRDDLTGGIGNDIYIVDNTGDICNEKPNEGEDEIRSTVNWTLGDDFENLTLVGSKKIKGYGNKLNNTLVGNDENNLLDGYSGSDKMEGRLGDDIYIVDNAKDKTLEKINQGVDIVRSSINWKLADNIEELELIGTANLKATGNKLENSIMGNDGDNLIDGNQGADKMSGMKGDDTYLVDNKDDKVVEKNKQGTDSIETALSFKLPNHVENLTITGSSKVTAEGNKLGNEILGNKKENTLNGGMGDDTIDGGKGIDLLLLSKKNNSLNLSIADAQKTGDGTMMIKNIENIDGGKGNDLLTGSKLKNTLLGGSGNDKLNGAQGNDYLDGGDGNDHLIGGSGKDTLMGGNGKDTFEARSEKGHIIIVDFENGVDNILLADGTKDFSMKDKGDDAYLYQNKDLVGIVQDGAGLLTIKGNTLI